MAEKSYHAPGIHLDEMARAIDQFFRDNNLETQIVNDEEGTVLIQGRRTQEFIRKFIGAATALTVRLRAEGKTLYTETGGADWLEKGLTAVGFGILAIAFPPVLLVTGAGVADQVQLQVRTNDFIDGYVAENTSADGGDIAGVTARSDSSITGKTCPNCGAIIVADSRFCIECGVATENTCPGCAHKNPLDARFCEECGTQLRK